MNFFYSKCWQIPLEITTESSHKKMSICTQLSYSHFGEKIWPEFKTMISRSEVIRANLYSIGPLFYLCNIAFDEKKSESWPVKFW